MLSNIQTTSFENQEISFNVIKPYQKHCKEIYKTLLKIPATKGKNIIYQDIAKIIAEYSVDKVWSTCINCKKFAIYVNQNSEENLSVVYQDDIPVFWTEEDAINNKQTNLIIRTLIADKDGNEYSIVEQHSVFPEIHRILCQECEDKWLCKECGNPGYGMQCNKCHKKLCVDCAGYLRNPFIAKDDQDYPAWLTQCILCTVT